MCGIAGIVLKSGNHENWQSSLFRMSRALSHRGPDGEGFFIATQGSSLPLYSEDTPVINKDSSRFNYNPKQSIEEKLDNPWFGFAHRRLSIIDLSEAGHQPMCDGNEDIWVTYNGEIYNYLELKEELIQKGFSFHTNTDTEVLINAYKYWGFDCLKHFNGMWAFALYDKAKQLIFCSRDRVGVKPFYFVNQKDAFLFASEQKAFLKSGLLKFEVNESHSLDFLLNASVEREEEYLFKHIQELKPGHDLIYDLKTHQFQQKAYYLLQDHIDNKVKSETEEIIEIREKLVKAVKIRLRSDVEVGSCLSGGIDSSTIAGIVHEIEPELKLKLFTSVFQSEKFDEANYASEVVRQVEGIWYQVTPTSQEFYQDLNKMVYSQDLPVWSTSTYAQFRVMKMAAENGIKVLLDGQGADEIFSGYSHHYLSYWKELIHQKKYSHVLKSIRDSKATFPNGKSVLAKQYLKHFFKVSNPMENYFKKQVLQTQVPSSDPIFSNLNQQLFHDYGQGRLKSYLKAEDRCSMAFSIESRVPFADDIELVHELFSLSSEMKIKNGQLKYLLREAAKPYLPLKIYQRKDKIGFETPQSKWLIEGKERVLEEINSLKDWLDIDRVNKDYNLLAVGRGYFLLRLLSFAVWQKEFSIIK